MFIVAVVGAVGSVRMPVCKNHADLTTFPRSGDGNCTATISSLSDWEVRRQDILIGIEALMGELPDRKDLPPLDVQVAATLTAPAYTRHTISFVAERGDQVPRTPALLYVPKGAEDDVPEPALPTILATHPTSALGKRWSDARNPPLNYAAELASRGFVVLAVDYPSMGGLSDFDCARAEAAGGRYASCTMKGIFNHMRGIDVLESLPYADTSRLASIGHSLGGHNAIFAAVFDARIKVVVSSCGWTPWAFYETHLPLSKSWALPKYMPRIASLFDSDPAKIPTDFYEMIAMLAPRPFFSNSPVTDFNFNVSGVWDAIPQLRTVWQRFADHANDTMDAGDHFHVEFPQGGCAAEPTSRPGGQSTPCGHDFPSGTRLDAYEFIERHLRL